MKDQNISIMELDAIRSIMDVTGKCYNDLLKQGISSEDLIKAYRFLSSCIQIIQPSDLLNKNKDFSTHEVNSIMLSKHGELPKTKRNDYPVFVWKYVCLELDKIIDAIYDLEKLSTLNKSLYLEYLGQSRICVIHAKYIAEFNMESLFKQ